MDPKQHKKLVNDTERLRKMVSKCSTETVVGYCAGQFLRHPEQFIGLTSPCKQLAFLLGLMLSTPEPRKSSEFGEKMWKKSVVLLESIVSAYGFMFLPKANEAVPQAKEWWETREVAMLAYLHYFNSGLMASTEQIRERIGRYVSPFDHELESSLGITATEATSITNWISDTLQRTVDRMQELKRDEEPLRHRLMDEAIVKGWDKKRVREEAEGRGLVSKIESIFESLNSMFKVSKSDIAERFGDKAAASYWTLFTATRGEASDLTYFTQHNVAEDKPLFLLDKHTAMCPSVHNVYVAVLTQCERSLQLGSNRESYLRKRDKLLEAETRAQFGKLFTAGATLLSEVYEGPDIEYEHDLVIKWKHKLFIVEAKASPPIEPFRDPDKAFTRLQRRFQSDRGIQKAYDQANRVRSQIESGSVVSFYDHKRKLVLQVGPKDVDQVYCICVTRDSFGALAVDLTLLLKKNKDDPFPWAVNAPDLENLIDAWTYFGWGPDKFCEYLQCREKLHGKVVTTDELEIAGFMIEHGGLQYIVDLDAGRVPLDPTYSEVFDRLFRAKHGGPKVVYAPTKPHFTDFGKELRKAHRGGTLSTAVPVGASTPVAPRKQGRNQPCACGSGKKYKKCCGA